MGDIGHDDPLPALVAEATPEALGRLVLSIAGMHAAGPDGRCPWCTPYRPAGWRRKRRRPELCQTRTVMLAELRTADSPRWTSA